MGACKISGLVIYRCWEKAPGDQPCEGNTGQASKVSWIHSGQFAPASRSSVLRFATKLLQARQGLIIAVAGWKKFRGKPIYLIKQGRIERATLCFQNKYLIKDEFKGYAGNTLSGKKTTGKKGGDECRLLFLRRLNNWI